VKVAATAAADSSGTYRIIQPADVLAHWLNLDIEVVPQKVGFRLTLSGADVVDADIEADVLVLQRPMGWMMPSLIELMQARGTAVVVELDDDFHTAHPNNRAFQLNHPRVSPVYNWLHLTECVKRADLVTVSTDQLARRYGSHGRVAVLRNYVPESWLDLPRRSNGATIGWAGTTVNHPVDLRATRGGVAMALNTHPGWRFMCVGGEGYADEICRQLELDPVRFTATPWRELEVHRLVVSQFDIGIAPLEDTVFNAAKSWLKGVEYAALGIPFVASDLPEYELLERRYGIGVLAGPKSKFWRKACNDLMNDELRASMGQMQREQVAKTLTIEKNAWRWPDAWEVAIKNRRWRASKRAHMGATPSR
jgi:glycosyltransferase involved in cell wall biosynthesis